ARAVLTSPGWSHDGGWEAGRPSLRGQGVARQGLAKPTMSCRRSSLSWRSSARSVEERIDDGHHAVALPVAEVLGKEAVALGGAGGAQYQGIPEGQRMTV